MSEAIEQVRLLIADTDHAEQVYTDPQIVQFLELESGHVKRAAAQALESYAAHIAQVAGPIRGLLDIRIGGEQSAATLLGIAARYRAGTPSAKVDTIHTRSGMLERATPTAWWL